MITDHRPLEGIFKKEIFEVENMRLQRIREKLAAYSFKVTWVKGKNHLIADALSRAPYFEASEENELYCHAIFSLKVSGDQALVWLQECRDAEYSRIREAILNDYGYKNLQGAKMLKDIWHDLSVDMETDLILIGNRRIFVPTAAIKQLLKLLHQGHCGFTKTYNLARELYYWGGMRNDISQMIDNCTACQNTRPSQQPTPMIASKPSDSVGAPMEYVGTDLFEYAGKHYLCLLYTSPSPRDLSTSRMPSSA